MAVDQWTGNEAGTVNWPLIREKAALYLGATVLMLLFGRQGLLLWQQGRDLYPLVLPSWTRILRRRGG